MKAAANQPTSTLEATRATNLVQPAATKKQSLFNFVEPTGDKTHLLHKLQIDKLQKDALKEGLLKTLMMAEGTKLQGAT